VAPLESSTQVGSIQPLGSHPTWSSLYLWRRAREGRESAVEALFVRQLPPLMRWAHGRLPKWVRNAADTADIVQDVLLQTFRRIDRFQPRGHRALQSYLRRSIQNRITDEVRRGMRVALEDGDSAPEQRSLSPSPLDLAIRQQARARYLAALDKIRLEDRLLIVGRIDLGYSYEQLAIVSGRVTPDATRVAVRRALVRLAKTMSCE
jgi:RNA polymerase sigma-70 factor, ECF subfamily